MDSEKKVSMLAYSPPNESPILRILGMNNRNKITFKMLHLTVEALEAAAAAAPLPHSAHLTPAAGTLPPHRRPHGAACSKSHQSPSLNSSTLQLSNVDSSSSAGPIHARTHTCCPAALRPARMWVNANLVCMRGHSSYKEYFSRFTRRSRLSRSEVNSCFCLLVCGRLACLARVMINSDGPPSIMPWKCGRTKRLGRPLPEKVKDGEGDGAFGSAAFTSF